MNIYAFHSRLFSSPRIIITDYPINKVGLIGLVNSDNNYSEENRWKLIELPIYPANADFK